MKPTFAAMAEAVLQFWFEGLAEADLARPRTAWFAKDDAFDATIRERFADLPDALASGALAPDPSDARQMLAALIAADQFPRNLYRGTARAFATDPLARHWAQAAVAAGLDAQLPPVARWFFYLPFEHSESAEDQATAVALFETLAGTPGGDNALDYARRHCDIIARFGRFPHRNAALGRPTTDEEAAFLQTPGSSF